ncbi:aldehyde oxidase [Mycolicibacterium wolinskyi]|uniref:Aldehyde oxidase n=1 Tax=Mycolicibacterium wolinskyi TaxID=59750 RepID=A0A132PED8_9MYCO|nr:xanthine dehydrogenase family protein molybdopterin-binding subunit [Mycolicibacterium wolinskyi]KWX20342.1 aldehyde oxidase [Mycolicibacterium wolinskyi]
MADVEVGRPVNRVEGRDKVTGKAVYTADTSVAGVTYAALVQSEIACGTVTEESLRHGTRMAAEAPGVLHVLTPLNCPALHALPDELTADFPMERRPPLSDLSVHYVGQHMALVVADSPENAVAAAERIKLDYVVEPARIGMADVPDGDRYQPDHFVKLVDEKLQDRRGSADEPDGGTKVCAYFRTPVNAHYPIELSATIAEWSGEDLTVHDATRWIAGERRVLACYLGIDEDRIRVLSPLVGGAFGSKSFLWMHVVLCAVAARAVGRPVKLVLTRVQMFTSTGHRPRTEQRVSLVADEHGTLLSTEQHTLTETSPVAHFCEPVGLSARFLYRSPRLVTTHTVAPINGATPCFMRGPGEAPGLFALESAIDQLAYACGVDPLAFRLANDPDYDQTNGKPWSGKHLRDCFVDGAERFGWARRPMAPRSMSRDGVLVGWGMATATYPGRRMPAGCGITTADGVVRFASATHEIGTGVRTVMTQVAADATGLPLSAVSFATGDSEFPSAPYSGASQTTATVGSAVHRAGTEWKRRLLSWLSSLDGATALDVRDGLIVCEGRTVATVADVLRDGGTALAQMLTFTVTSDGGAHDNAVSQSFGAHFCEVEVDEAIGRATVTRWVSMLDCGRVLNPKLARNQVMGGVIFGLGMALLEQVPYDARTAQLIGEYYVPTHADIPEFDIAFVDTADYGLDPIGVRGIGEIGACGVPAAIANAIFHATGKRLRDLPITLEMLMGEQ